MYDQAIKIFEFLPIRKRSLEEQRYIDYLWNSFSLLNQSAGTDIPSFSVIPFHLLFVLAVQYRILRVSKAHLDNYKLIYTIKSLRPEDKILIEPDSVFTFSRLSEKELIDALKLLSVDETVIGRAKALVNKRSGLAHPNGSIASELDEMIEEYIDILTALQPYFEKINNLLAKEWLKEIETDEDETIFVDTRLAGEYVCPADLRSGLLGKEFSEYVEL